jgi:hypothetical protein
MKTQMYLSQLLFLFAFFSVGCHAPGVKPMPDEKDRQAILGMAGTFAVTFDFDDVLPAREGYELAKPFSADADELVVVVADEPRYISLQHLLVVRHDGGVHVINHWRQDWRYQADSAYFYSETGAWARTELDPDFTRGKWVQTVYNVADSPRYSSVGWWRHDWGVSTWVGSPAMRPLPLRENRLADQYDTLYSNNTHTVTEQGWLHLQDNLKRDSDHPTHPILSVERGTNRYTRIPDKGFEDAHDYWKNTEAYWREVRSVWDGVFAEHEVLRLRKKWKDEALFSHLFGLADEYSGQADVSEARSKIEEVIEAFVIDD